MSDHCVFSQGSEFNDRFYTAESVEANEVLSWASFWILFFAIGASIDLGDLIDISRRIRGLTLGVFFHYLLTPIFALIWGSIFRTTSEIDQTHVASLLILACVPGSPQSVILTWQARGDVGLAVLLFFLTSCLDAGIFPAWSYYWASTLSRDTCYVTLPTLDLLLGHITLLFPLLFGAYARFRAHSIIFWFQTYAHALTTLYILIITLSRFIEWKIQNIGGLSLLMTFLFILLNASCVYMSSLLLLTSKQAKALLFQLCMASLLLAYPATRLTFNNDDAIDPTRSFLFWSCFAYPIAFYFSYASQNEDIDMKIPQPMFFDKNVAGLFQTMRHLNQYSIGLHDDFAVQGSTNVAEVSSDEDQDSVYTDGSREPYDPLSSVTPSLSEMQTRGIGAKAKMEDEDKFLTISEVKAAVTKGATIVPIPQRKPEPSEFSESPRSNGGVEMMPVSRPEVSNLTPRDSPDPRRISSRSRKRRKKRAKKAKRLVRNLSPASDSSDDDSDDTGVASTTSTDFTTVGNSDVASRIRHFNPHDRPQTVIRASRKKKKKKKKHRQRYNPMDAYSATPSVSQSTVSNIGGYQPVTNPMNVPVYTSSYVGSDMMNGPYHGEGMSLTSTHYSHHIEPGAAQQSQAQWQQYQYPSYHSNSVPSQTYAYYYK